MPGVVPPARETDDPQQRVDATRKLALRRRSDLLVSRQTLAGRTAWAVKDPLTLRYFHLSDEEYCIFEALDESASLDSLQAEFERRFAPRRLSLGQLHSFLGLLHQEGLILVDAPGQTAELLERARVLRRNRWLSGISNVLAIRFPGIDPQPFLDWLLPKCRWMFSAGALAAGALFVAGAVALVAANFELVRARLSDLALPDAATIFWLAVALGVTKILHELGHALACRHFGGECHEMGFMLLVFTPCLYCNVSDAWMLGSKWRRAAIGSAGVCVELLLAAIGTFVWFGSEPGLVNTLAFNMMLVSSAGTLLFNGNPLMRYDGYFVLSDLVEVPNLAQQAAAVAREEIGAWALGIPARRDGDLSSRRRLFLAVYAVASAAYRAVVLFGIFWFVHRVLKARHLEAIAIGLGALVLAGLVAGPLVRGVRFVQNAYWSRQMKPRRALLAAALTAAILSAILLTPLPHRVAAPVVLEVENARRVYALVGGMLQDGLEIGAAVAAGDRIARLENLELELEIARLCAERDSQKLHVETLKRRQSHDNEAAAQIPVAEEALADLEERLERRESDRERLFVTAPASGTVLPGRRKPITPDATELATWSGLPLERINRGCYLEPGTLICLVGDPERLEASLVLDQADVEFIQPGQAVEIRLDQDPTRTISGTVRGVAEIDLKVTPPELLPEGAVPTRPDEQGVMRPAGTVYQARVAIEQPDRPLVIGEAGQARIEAGRLSLGRRLLRSLSRTIRFAW